MLLKVVLELLKEWNPPFFRQALNQSPAKRLTLPLPKLPRPKKRSFSTFEKRSLQIK
jgi:hypothetical protein